MQKFTFFFQGGRNSDFSEESTQLSLYSRKLGTKIFDENVKLLWICPTKIQTGPHKFEIVQILFVREKNKDIRIHIFFLFSSRLYVIWKFWLTYLWLKIEITRWFTPITMVDFYMSSRKDNVIFHICSAISTNIWIRITVNDVKNV